MKKGFKRGLMVLIVLTLVGCSGEIDVLETQETICSNTLDREVVAHEPQQVQDEIENRIYHMAISEEERARLEEEVIALALTYEDLYKNAYKGNAINVVIPDEVREEIIKHIGAQGFAVQDIYEDANIENSELMEAFCIGAQAGETVQATLYQVNTHGGLWRMDFQAEDKKMNLTLTALEWNEKDQPVIYGIERYEFCEWKYTPKGYLMFEKAVPEELEMSGYTGIRIQPIPATYSALNEKYIKSIGYQGNNLFLLDWDKEHLEQVDFNDLYEYIYYIDCGDRLPTKGYLDVPKEKFEGIMQKYFPVTPLQLEQGSYYDAMSKTYPWYALACWNYTPQYMGIPYPEVVDVAYKEEGIIILTVDAVWEERGMDCAFTHKVTIQENKDGTFKYLSNQVVPSENNIFPHYQSRNEMAEKFQ